MKVTELLEAKATKSKVPADPKEAEKKYGFNPHAADKAFLSVVRKAGGFNSLPDEQDKLEKKVAKGLATLGVANSSNPKVIAKALNWSSDEYSDKENNRKTPRREPKDPTSKQMGTWKLSDER